MSPLAAGLHWSLSTDPMSVFPTLSIGRRPVLCRVLALYRVEADALRRLLPAATEPRLVHGYAVGEVCYTRLGQSRFLRGRLSPTSDHLTYRFAVERVRKEGNVAGTWVARRETSSWLEARCGEKILRGEYGRSEFRVREDHFGIELEVTGERGFEFYLRAEASGSVRGSLFGGPHALETFLGETGDLAPQDVFAPEADALDVDGFAPEPLAVFDARSVFFGDRQLFPSSSAVLDSAWRLVTKRCELVAERSPLQGILGPGQSSAALPSM